MRRLLTKEQEWRGFFETITFRPIRSMQRGDLLVINYLEGFEHDVVEEMVF